MHLKNVEIGKQLKKYKSKTWEINLAKIEGEPK